MNVQEGAKRMRRAGIWLVVLPVCWMVLAWLWRAIAYLHTGTGLVASGLGIADIFILATPGALLWLVGWIVEGFAQKERS